MIPRKIGRSLLVAGAVCGALVQVGCKTEGQPSAVVGDYTFSRDFDGQRRVLRIEPSPEQPAECMLTDLPADGGARWKETMLDTRLGESEFCYVPQVVVAGLSSPWRFALQPEVTLSEQSQELIDEFLSAHEACWKMTGGL
jgi:hypothetical protein